VSLKYESIFPDKKAAKYKYQNIQESNIATLLKKTINSKYIDKIISEVSVCEKKNYVLKNE